MRCRKCGHSASGAAPAQCPACRSWGTFVRWTSLGEVEGREAPRLASGLPAIDWLVGGGLVRGCVYRAFGAPGCGKSTLALDLATRQLQSLYLTSEERLSALRLRADRLGRADRALNVGEIRSVEDVADLPPGLELLVVDSLNMLRSAGVSGVAGSNEQLLHATGELVRIAQTHDVALLVVTHVNREGGAAGSTGVDHGVDCQIELVPPESEDGPGTARVLKNRHGPSWREVAYWHREDGLDYEVVQKQGRNPVRDPHARSSEAAEG